MEELSKDLILLNRKIESNIVCALDMYGSRDLTCDTTAVLFSASHIVFTILEGVQLRKDAYEALIGCHKELIQTYIDQAKEEGYDLENL